MKNKILVTGASGNVGKGKNSFIDVRDIGAVVAKTLMEEGHANEACTLTGTDALDCSQAADIFSQVLDRNIVYNNPSPFRFHRHMKKQHGMNSKFIWIMQILYLTVRLGRSALITDKVFHLLGRQPISL